MLGIFRRFARWGNKPSAYGTLEKAFDKLQVEKTLNGMSLEYWRIWYEEVCPAYRNLTEATPIHLRSPQTDEILEDIDKPVSQRKHF